ncbi:hypothetical protein GCM10010341_15660 [Streptomyces noursei]|nr:hypothetical protein GCM10010341_15660 [Streptomyces noursei]
MGDLDLEMTPPSIQRIARCHTKGCPTVDQPFKVTLYENAGEPKYIAVCGRCGHTITDLDEGEAEPAT